MSAPRLLDLFCCEGGAGTGYARAGFEVVGIDLEPRYAKRYPFEFHAADALEYLAAHHHEFDAFHGSPPCQAYSITKHTHSKKHPELVEPLREAFQAIGKPWVIENVVGAPLRDPLMLCGSEFGLTATDDDGTPLRLERHRLFESNVFLWGHGGCQHDTRVQVGGVYGGGSQDRAHAHHIRRGGYTPGRTQAQDLLGIDWMTYRGMSQSIPPAYTEWVGSQVLAHINREAVA